MVSKRWDRSPTLPILALRENTQKLYRAAPALYKFIALGSTGNRGKFQENPALAAGILFS